jgi:hypothetical protein
VLGQIATLVLAGALLYSGYQRAFPALAPERAAVLAWLDTNAEEYDIVEWFPVDAARDPGATIVRVKYKYFSSSHKRIVTDRTFTIRDGQVASVEQTD